MSLMVIKPLDRTIAGRHPTYLSPMHALKPPVPGKQTQRNLSKSPNRSPSDNYWANLLSKYAPSTSF